MRVHKLLLDLKTFLDASLSSFPLPDPSRGRDILGCAKCFFGNVPDTGEDELPERFPFVLIRWQEGESREDGENGETVALILGVYAANGPEEAELVTAMLADHLRLCLMRSRTLAAVFELQLPLTTAKPDPEKKQHNYHIATIITRWNHRTPRRNLSEGESNE